MPPLERIAEARASALAALTRASGSESLCTLSRERLPAAKYHEGAVAALGEALRAVRRDEPVPEPQQWGSAFAAHARADMGWRAYIAGGRDALAALADSPRLDTSAVARTAATG